MSSGLEAGETDELGRINKVDPLGITSLRVRGMWQIKNPSKVFSGVAALDPEMQFQAFAMKPPALPLLFPEPDCLDQE